MANHPVFDGEAYSRLQYEISKFKDISTIMMRLEQQGNLAKIHQLFSNIFEEEHSFTVKELQKMNAMLKGQENFDLRAQYELNSSIFKSNLTLILQSVVQNLWESYVLSYRASLHEISSVKHDSPRAVKSGLQTIQENSEFAGRLGSTLTPTVNLPVCIDTSPSDNKQGGLPVVALRLNTHQKSAMSENAPPASASAMLVDISKRRSEVASGSSQNSRRMVISKDASVPQINNARSSPTHHQKPLGNSPSKQNLPLESEFNYSKGIQFPREERKQPFVKKELVLIPGPGQYNPDAAHELVKKRAQSPTFNKSPKTSMFDRVPNESPGFIYYPSRHFTSK